MCLARSAFCCFLIKLQFCYNIMKTVRNLVTSKTVACRRENIKFRIY